MQKIEVTKVGWVFYQIKNVTCNRDLSYIGHSMGCTALLVTSSQVAAVTADLR